MAFFARCSRDCWTMSDWKCRNELRTLANLDTPFGNGSSVSKQALKSVTDGELASLAIALAISSVSVSKVPRLHLLIGLPGGRFCLAWKNGSGACLNAAKHKKRIST